MSFTPAADYSDKEGYGVTLSSETATITASATVENSGVIMEGNPTTAGYATEFVTVGLFGMKGTCRVRLGGTIVKGVSIQQHTDGTFITDAGSGNRVLCGTALQAGVSGDLIEAILSGPCYYAA